MNEMHEIPGPSAIVQAWGRESFQCQRSEYGFGNGIPFLDFVEEGFPLFDSLPLEVKTILGFFFEDFHDSIHEAKLSIGVIQEMGQSNEQPIRRSKIMIASRIGGRQAKG